MNKELSLREIIEILLAGKWIIAIITIVCMIFSGVFGFVFIKPEYSAKTMLLTNPISENPNKVVTEEINQMINAMGKYPDMTIETFQQQFVNPTVLKNTIDKLGLLQKDGSPLPRNKLAEKINVSVIDDTNLLRVMVTDEDPIIAAQIANKLSEEFIDYITMNARKIGEQAITIIEDQMRIEEGKLEEQSKILQNYYSSSKNIEQLRLEVNSLTEHITQYKSDLVNVEKQIASDETALKTLTNGKESVTGIDFSKDIKINIPYEAEDMSQEIQLGMGNANELEKSLMTIKVTEIETRLVQNLAEQNAVKSKITEMENRITEIHTILADEEYKYEAIQRNYNLALQTYNAYLNRHKEALIGAASNIGGSAIIVSSPAVEPLTPIGRGKMFYIAIGTALGFILGAFIVIFKAYWKSFDEKNEFNN